jgi:hypothetical protein
MSDYYNHAPQLYNNSNKIFIIIIITIIPYFIIEVEYATFLENIN